MKLSAHLWQYGSAEDAGTDRCSPVRAREVLEALTEAHADLLEAMKTMAAVTAEPKADASAYPHARWRLSQASRRRRTLVVTACTEASRGATASELAAIGRLREEDAPLLRRSASHVQAWTNERIAAEWEAYCAASHAIREEMKVRIEAERATLYPLLRSRAGS